MLEIQTTTARLWSGIPILPIYCLFLPEMGNFVH